MKISLFYILMMCTLSSFAQSKWENLSLSMGVGINNLSDINHSISYLPSSQSSPCNRCFTTSSYRSVQRDLRIPLRISYNLNRFVFDITYSVSDLFKRNWANTYLGYWELHSNIGFDLLKQTRLSSQPKLHLGLNYSRTKQFLSRSGTDKYLGLYLTFGPEKWKFRYSFSKGLSNFEDSFSTLDFMYCIYPSRKREKKKGSPN